MADTLLFTLLGIDELSDVFRESGKEADSLAAKFDAFGATGIKSLAGVAAASLASGAAVGGAVAGLTLAVGAAGIALIANNENVGKSVSALGADALAATTRSAQPIVDATGRAIGSVRTMVGQAQPLLAAMFRDSAPHIVEFTGGISRLALNALPGMSSAVKSSGAAVKGTADLMASSGSAIGGFFEEVSHGSESGGIAMSSLGRIVNTVLPPVGSLLVQLADVYAQNAPRIEAAITNVVAVFANLSGGSLPVLAAAAGTALDVLDGLLGILGPLSEDLGGLVGMALAAAAAIKIVGFATSTVKSGVGNITALSTAMRTAGATSGVFAARVGAMVAMMGGPLALVMAAAVVGLYLLGRAQESSAEAARKHSSFVQALTTSLRESAGIIDLSTRKTVAADEAVKGAAESAKQFGFNSSQVVDAVLGQGDALDQLRTKLTGIVEASKEYATTGEDSNVLSWTGTYTGQGAAAAKLLEELNRLNGGTTEAKDAAAKYGIALQSANTSMLVSTSSGAKLATAVTTLKEVSADADSRIRALQDALDALAGGSLNVQEAQSKVNGQLIQFGDLAGDSTDKTKGWGEALIGADGNINTLLPNGLALFNQLNGLRDSSAGLAQSTYDLSQRQGDDLAVSLDKARASMTRSRDSVIDLAEKMGLSRDKAVELADAFGLSPDKVEIAISTPYMTETQRELQILRSRVEEVPGRKSISVESLTEEARRKLEQLGYKVRDLPNGRVEVTSNTDPAWNNLNGFLNARVSKTVPVYYESVNAPGTTIGRQRQARGGVLIPMALGGLTGLRSGDGGVAQLFPKNDERVIGDRLDVPEVFAPLDGSVRTRSILQIANRSQGIDTGGGGNALVVGGSSSQVNHWSISFPNVTDAAEVRRQLLELQRDLGGVDLFPAAN